MALDAKVKKYSGDSAGLSSDSMMESIKQGIDYTLSVVKSQSPQNLPLFGRKLLFSLPLKTGYISGISITAGGSGYANSSTLAFSGGGGTGAQGWITLTSANGNVVNGVGLGPSNSSPTSKTGEGYTSTPTASIANGGSGSGATFAVTTVITDGMDLSILNIFDVLRVERKNQVARKVKDELIHKVNDSKSIYYSTSSNPSYIVNSENILTLFPDASASATGTVYCISSSSGKTINLSTEEIKDNDITVSGTANIGVENFPNIWKELVVLHAAELLLVERLSDFRDKLPTDLDADTTLFNQIADVSAQISLDTALPSFTNPTFPAGDVNDALTKAQNLIDGTTMGGDTENESVQYWLADEDEDMVQVTLGTAAQELSRANAILGDFNAELSHNIQAFQQDIAKMGTELSEEQAKMGAKLQEYQANLAKKIQLYNTVIQKLSTDYQWCTQQLQVVSSKKQEFISTMGSAGQGEVQERQI
jgi:hypothetical protein